MFCMHKGPALRKQMMQRMNKRYESGQVNVRGRESKKPTAQKNPPQAAA
jgi:hypothetical protein